MGLIIYCIVCMLIMYGAMSSSDEDKKELGVEVYIWFMAISPIMVPVLIGHYLNDTWK